jgi:hypothetical protein
VDDVVEVANYASLPVTGEVGKIYITLDTNFIYRWTGSTYVEIKDSSAVWGAITGTLSNQTDLQNALNAKLNLTGGTLSGALTLGSSSGDNQTLLNLPASNKLIYHEGVGSLYGFNIESGVDNSLFLTNTEGGYYQTLYFGDSRGGYNIFGISTSSNSGSTWNPRFVINQNGNIGLNKNNPSEILDVAGNGLFSGNVTANTIVKSGGTSTQFLKADGSVDSNTYLTTSSAASTYVPYTGASGAVNLGAYDLTVNSIKVGKGAGNVFDNTRVGDAALNSNTSGGSNTAIGYNALLSNTIAGGNTSIGAYSLLNNVSGANNTAIGYNAGQSITTGSNNVIIGGYAGTSALASNVVLSDGSGNIRFQFDGTNTFIGQTGNLLIGVSLNAGYKLDVNGTARISGALSGTSASFSSTISATGLSIGSAVQWNAMFYTAGASPSYIQMANGSTGAASANGMIVGIDGSGNGVINVRGSFGLTTTVAGIDRYNISSTGIHTITGAATFSSSVTAVGDIQSNGIFRDYQGEALLQTTTSAVTQLGSFGAATSRTLVLIAGNSERLRITSSGNVGIGTTTPITAGGSYIGLNISGATGSSLVLTSGANHTYLYAVNGGSDFAIENAGAQVFRAGSTERMRITSAGTVCIGNTTGAGDKLAIAQSGAQWAQTINHTNATQYQIEFRYNGTAIGSITGNGTMTSYNITSDYRLKEDLKPINGLDIVNKIKVYDYKWKANDSRMDGVLAHELAEVLPYAVTGVKDGEQMQSVDYSKIVPVLIQAIKDQQVQIEQLKNK